MTGASAYVHLLDDEDDARRLVVADELQQRGDPLGEFIAVQCELQRLPTYASGRRFPLERREEALLRRHRVQWLSDLPLTDVEQKMCTFRGGFPHHLTLDVDRLGEVGEPVLRSTIRALALSQRGSRIDPQWLRYIERLAFRFEAPSLELFRSCERLCALDLTGGRLPEGTAAKLANLQTLTDLDVTRVTSNDLEALARGGPPALTSLGLDAFDFTEATATALGHATWNLSKLSISQPPSSAKSLRIRFQHTAVLANASWSRTISSLTLSSAYAGIAVLAEVPLPRLTRLTASYTLDDKVIDGFCAAPWLPQLTELDLSNNRLSEAALAKLGRAPFDNLTALLLRLNDIGNDRKGANIFVEAELPKLKVLDLRGSNIGDADIERLCAAPWLRHLEELDLSRNHITERGFARLSRAPLSSLTDLVLEKNFALDSAAFDGFRASVERPLLRIHY